MSKKWGSAAVTMTTGCRGSRSVVKSIAYFWCRKYPRSHWDLIFCCLLSGPRLVYEPLDSRIWKNGVKSFSFWSSAVPDTSAFLVWRCCRRTQRPFCATTPRCCASAWAYPETGWERSTENGTKITSMTCTTRKRPHQAGSRTSCLSGPTLMRENWCVWIDGRTDEWVLKLWVSDWSPVWRCWH